MTTSRILLIITPLFLMACGGGGGGAGEGASDVATSNEALTTTSTIDGDSIELTPDSDGFIVDDNKGRPLKSLTSPVDHQFKASQVQTVSVVSAASLPCHLNIYSRYSQDKNDVFLPEGDSKVIQAYSADCSYSGRLYAMKHWDKLLLEVIDSSLSGGSEYYEFSIHSASMSINIR